MPKLILITGYSSCGKSTYSTTFKAPIITFDNVINYKTLAVNYQEIKNIIEKNKGAENIILDAYIFFLDPTLEKLKNIFNNNITSIEIHHIYTSLDNIAIKTIDRIKGGYNPSSSDYSILIEHIIKDISDIDNICKQLKQNEIIDKYIYVYRQDGNYVYHNDNEHLKLILNGHDMIKIDYLMNYIDKTSGDPKYQTIEINNKIIRLGASNCPSSWANILKTGIEFTNKKVCDLGSFNGYFSIKCKKAGALSVDGYDVNEPAIKISKLIALYNNLKCSFYKKNLGVDEFISDNYDIILALNMLHHVKLNNGENGYNQVIDGIFKHCKEAIFEVNDKEIPDIKKYADINSFTLIKSVESHRKTMFGNRYVLYYKQN